MAEIIDGKALALKVREGIAAEVLALRKQGIVPSLAVVLVGEEAASLTYVKNKREACAKAGIENIEKNLPATVSQDALLKLINELNADRKVHGVLVQLHLPKHIDEKKILEAIEPAKDVDCFHPVNVGRLFTGDPGFLPCTPAAVMALIDSTGIDITGKKAVVIGRSNIVGKPAAILLMQRNATVTICHSKTIDLADEVRHADIVVAAMGREKFVKGDWIKPGAIVIDVGINRTKDGKLTGDVDFDEASKRAGRITPVPGGVGPMTIAMLLKNTVKAATRLSF